MKIEFYSENVDIPDLDKGLIRRWINEVAAQHGKTVGNISYVFTDDEGILKVNREFLSHDYYTDIISFDYSRRRLISGDLYISLDTVLSNSRLVGATYEDELYRVIIHGILHLCGINDKGPGEREIMEEHEDSALNKLRNFRANS